MKKSFRYLIAVYAAAGALSMSRLSAQTDSYDPVHSLAKLENSWLKTGNPSSIGVRTLPDIGSVRFTGDHVSGNLHRAMESDNMNSWGFGADSYKSLKKLNLWGDFTFRDTHHHGRQWSDNFDPYNGNPYQAGSNIKGSYVEQTFDFGVKISSKCLWDRLWFGLGFDYSLGDLSRTIDPRSRVQMADLQLTPGMIIRLADKHRLGLNLSYRYRKEKNNKYVSKSTEGNAFKIWRQEGLGVYSQILSNRFERRAKASWLGAGLQYSYDTEGFSLLFSSDYSWRKDRLEDLLKESPGNYAAHEAGALLDATWKNAEAMQNLQFHFNGETGSSDRFFQKLQTETNPETGISQSWYETLVSSKSFLHRRFDTGLEYSYIRRKGKDCSWFVSPSIMLSGIKDRYIFYTPNSDMSGMAMSFQLEGGMRLLSIRGHRFYASLGTAYRLNLSGNLSISPELEKTELLENVNRPDYILLTSDIFSVSLNLDYIFPLTTKINGFVRLEGRELVSTSLARSNRNSADIAAGILYRF